MARTRNYSDFLNSVIQLIGIPPSRLTTEVAASINQFFNNAIRDIWIATQWYDNCPRGEARFVGNKLTYSNDLTKTAYWTPTYLTITANQLANPLDGSVTASKLMEEASSGEHKVVQNVTSFFPSQSYTITSYVRPNGRNNVQLVAYDGSTVSYLGDPTKGVYVWGCLVQQTTNVPVSDLLLPWQQVGEQTIDAVFDVYQASPSSAFYPRQQGYLLTQDGIQMINGAWATYIDGVNQSSIYGILPCNPVFLFYRKYAPTYTGDDYSASTSYIVNDQVYYTTSAGVGNYYRCTANVTGVAPTGAGSSANYWEVIPLYTVFLQYCIYRAYADWLISDGQLEKADRASAMADRKLADSIEVQERQMGDVLPTKFQTHVTSRAY